MHKKFIKLGKTNWIHILAALIGFSLVCSNGMGVEYVYGKETPTVSQLEHNAAQDPQLKSLIARLHDSNAFERQRAAIALGNLGNAGALEPLIRALEDEDDFVRNFAARSLGELGDLRAVDPLIRRMRDKNLLVRRSAINALGNFGDSRALDSLIEAAKNENDIVRRAALKALGNIDSAKGIAILIESLRNEDSYIKNGAEQALINIGTPAIPELVAELCDWVLGPRVLGILKNFEWQPSSQEERVWAFIAERDRQILSENWETTRNILIRYIATADNHQVQNAVFALIAMGRDETLNDLVAVMKEKGTAVLAKAFQNCGNATLLEAANLWTSQNEGNIDDVIRIPNIQWGEMESF